MKKYQISYLSAEFYKKYNSSDYPEIEHKEERPYLVLLIKIDENTFAIPFRTNVDHNSCYKFKNSQRETNSSTGLDYSKAVIVNNPEYISFPATIDNSEYIELNKKYFFIIKQFTSYVSDYKLFVSGELNEYKSKKYRYTTLKYFHEELGILAN